MSAEERTGYHMPPGTLAPVDVDIDKSRLTKSAGSSIGKKYLMAWAGLFWCFFVLMHLVGNFSIFLGAEAYNGYSKKLADLGPILIVAEIGLVALLLTHVVMGIIVSLQNSAARPVGYEVDRAKGDRNLASSTMIWTGIVILVFIVVHLVNFKFGEHVEKEGMVDFHGMVVSLFQSPLYVLGYVAVVAILGLHMAHALQSSLRTIGWNRESSFDRIKKASMGFGVFVAVGYASIPIWAILVKGAQ
jgi:succinate dehydrogenase / fumarate reductase cytochrome b subunit